MAEDADGTEKPATSVDEAAPANDSSDEYADDGGDAEDGDYDDEDEDEGADFDADDESDVDADADSSEQPAPAPIADPPPPPPPAGRGTLMIIGVFVAMVGAFAYFKLRTPDEVVPPAVWARYHDVANTFSLELPAQPIQGTDPQPNLMVKLGPREYGVVWHTIGSEEGWKNFEALLINKGTLLRRLDIADSELAFVFKDPQGGITGVRTVRRGDVGYLILSAAYIDNPDLERPLRTFRFEPVPH